MDLPNSQAKKPTIRKPIRPDGEQQSFPVDTGAQPDTVFLPVVLNNQPTPTLVPKVGYWLSTWESFYVTDNGENVDNFAMAFTVQNGGNFIVTHNSKEAITNAQFSFTGGFYASGVFTEYEKANGTDGPTLVVYANKVEQPDDQDRNYAKLTVRLHTAADLKYSAKG